ncbi:hypothetical protein RvY_09594-1 [Ramazzottius varieornatus]|uniref:Uncharacterized protein n=1 Tax=Ramazzottius varieornatus TaxID=947166 RepID=A0A1D1V9V5_RAMVA|nr:hypothetical protein RvY_09594-1 [Ramazzottius varieornatus]
MVRRNDGFIGKRSVEVCRLGNGQNNECASLDWESFVQDAETRPSIQDENCTAASAGKKSTLQGVGRTASGHYQHPFPVGLFCPLHSVAAFPPLGLPLRPVSHPSSRFVDLAQSASSLLPGIRSEHPTSHPVKQ